MSSSVRGWNVPERCGAVEEWADLRQRRRYGRSGIGQRTPSRCHQRRSQQNSLRVVPKIPPTCGDSAAVATARRGLPQQHTVPMKSCMVRQGTRRAGRERRHQPNLRVVCSSSPPPREYRAAARDSTATPKQKGSASRGKRSLFSWPCAKRVLINLPQTFQQETWTKATSTAYRLCLKCQWAAACPVGLTALATARHGWPWRA
jgi:hypothetical protein